MNFDQLTNNEKAAYYERWLNTMDYYSCKLAYHDEGDTFDAVAKQFCFHEWFMTFYA